MRPEKRRELKIATAHKYVFLCSLIFKYRKDIGYRKPIFRPSSRRIQKLYVTKGAFPPVIKRIIYVLYLRKRRSAYVRTTCTRALSLSLSLIILPSAIRCLIVCLIIKTERGLDSDYIKKGKILKYERKCVGAPNVNRYDVKIGFGFG